MRRPPFHHNHGHPNTKSILQHSIKHALKNISSRDWTSSSVEGQYWGTSHATTSTFSALNNLPIPSRDWGPDAVLEKGGNQRRDQGEIYHQPRGHWSGSEPHHHLHIFSTQQSSNTIQGLRTRRRWRKEETSGGIGEKSKNQPRGHRSGSEPRHHLHIFRTQQPTNRAHPHPNRNKQPLLSTRFSVELKMSNRVEICCHPMSTCLNKMNSFPCSGFDI